MRKKSYWESPEDIVLGQGLDFFQKIWERYEYAHPVVRAILLIVIMLLLVGLFILLMYIFSERKTLQHDAFSFLSIGHQLDYLSAKVLTMTDVLFAAIV